MKNLLRIFWLISLLGWLSINTAQAANLEIYNDWDYPVHVKEDGTDKDIAAGGSYSTYELFSIYALEISYKPDNSGNWVRIKGCSRGTYGGQNSHYGTRLKVYITGKDSDPRVPVCRSEVLD